MLSYISPDRYRRMALGVDLSAKTDADLAALASSATAEVNRSCAAPYGHDFRGGSVEREEHPWNTGNSYLRASGRIWPKHAAGVMPITACNLIDIYTTQTQYIRFTQPNIFISSRLGWVEPVAAPITTALFTAVPPWLLSTPMAYIDYEYGRTFPVTGELLIDSGDHLTYWAQNEWWSDDDVTVLANGTDSTPTVNRDAGTVTYDTPNSASDLITASYSYKLPEEIRIATSIVMTDMLGYANINASGLTGLSGIRVEEIELRQSARVGYAVYDLHPAAKVLLRAWTYVSFV